MGVTSASLAASTPAVSPTLPSTRRPTEPASQPTAARSNRKNKNKKKEEEEKKKMMMMVKMMIMMTTTTTSSRAFGSGDSLSERCFLSSVGRGRFSFLLLSRDAGLCFNEPTNAYV